MSENVNRFTSEGLDRNQQEECAALVRRIVAEIEDVTLRNSKTYFGRLIHFASLRDHSTGRYSHDGILARYSNEQAMHEAISLCHSKCFEEFVNLSLEEQVREVAEVLKSHEESIQNLLKTWSRLRSFEILPPENCHPIARQLFARNLETALKVLLNYPTGSATR